MLHMQPINILFILESFQVTAPDTGGHVTWQAEVTVTQNEQQDGTGEVNHTLCT